ncbi:MAG TPA: DUF3299 domain-containing protein [Burkholderiaceae bacterium]|nr:DUF3299 domain-containing protein [Burkholderiaceae bacterium]
MNHRLLAAALAAVAAASLPATAQNQMPSLQPPLAPFAAPLDPTLPVVPGAVPWELLAKVKPVPHKDRIVPEFDREVLQLNRREVKLAGFMMPLQASERQTHFLLTVTPQTCAFCIPTGPEGIVEVRAKTPVRTTLEPVVVTGTMEVLKNDPMGVYYRLTDARPAPAR